MRTSELVGDALDWAVANCEGWTNTFCDGACHCLQHRNPEGVCKTLPHFSTNWSLGGTIIERMGFSIETFKGRKNDWRCFDFHIGNVYAGSTPLIAAMRCYVASKLGDEVEVPDELLRRD